MPDLPSLDGFILAAAALLIVSMGILRGISKASRPSKAPKPPPQPPKSDVANVAKRIVSARAADEQAKVKGAAGDGDKLAALINQRRRGKK